MSRAGKKKRKGETNIKLNKTTGRQTKILKFYVQRLGSPFPTTTKPVLFAFLMIQNSLHRQYLVPRFYYSFRYNKFPMRAPRQLRGCTQHRESCLQSLPVPARGFLPAQIRALTGPWPLLLHGCEHIWSTNGSGFAGRKLASGGHTMPTSHSDEPDPERFSFSFCYPPLHYQFYFNMQLTITQMFTSFYSSCYHHASHPLRWDTILYESVIWIKYGDRAASSWSLLYRNLPKGRTMSKKGVLAFSHLIPTEWKFSLHHSQQTFPHKFNSTRVV